MTGLLKISGLSKRFGGLQALSDISLGVEEGEIVGLIGPNGAGKTTLFSTLVGLIRPSAGSIRLNGRELVGLKPHKIAAAGMVKTFQNVALFLESDVLDNVLIGALLHHGVTEAREEARRCLERAGLTSIADKKAADLSFPERARVEVARALCTEPKILLLDEAMAALSHAEMDEFMSLIRSLRDKGLAIIVVEHHMRAIMALCQRIAVVNFGRKIAEGTPQEIARDPQVVQAYLGRGAAA